MRLVQGERSSKHISDLTYLKAPAWVVVGGLSQDPGLSFGERRDSTWSGRALSGAWLRALLLEAINTLRAIPTRLAVFTASFQGIIIIARGSRVGCGCSAPNVQLPGFPWISPYTTFCVCSSSELDASTRFARRKYS